MIEAIQTFLRESVGEEWCVFLCSMIPIIELRGAIPLGAVFGLNPFLNYLISVVGNMMPVPFILLLIRSVIGWMERSHIAFFNKIGGWLTRKAEKNRLKIEKYAFWGVAAFVAIPLPATGAWTGSLVAAMIHMNFWKAWLSALIGVMVAGAIITLLSYGVAAIV